MKRLVVLVALVATPVMAQEQQKFVPYTVNEQEHQAIVNALGEIPAKFSIPLINKLYQLEQTAVTADKAKPAEPKKE